MNKKINYTLSISENFVFFDEARSVSDYEYSPLSVENALGDLIASLEESFPDIAKPYPYEYDINSLRQSMMDNIVEDIKGKTKKRVWNIPEDGASLINFYELVSSGSGSINATMDIVEGFRLDHRITNAPIMKESLDGMIFTVENIDRLTQVIYGLLYFYAKNEFHVKRCKFCGKWFAFKNEKAQKNFCNRPFQYIDWNGEEKRFPNCQDAREKIMARCKRREKQIYNALDQNGGTASGKMNQFMGQNGLYLKDIKKNPSCERILDYERYLYIECDKYYHRYGRL